MSITDPTLAAAIAATGVPLSADYAPQPATPRWRQARSELIAKFYAYMPVTGAKTATDLLDEVIAEALLEGTAEIQMRSFGCPGFEGNPVAPDQCAGCGETNDDHEEAGR